MKKQFNLLNRLHKKGEGQIRVEDKGKGKPKGKKKKTVVIIAVIVVLIFIVKGCAGGGDSGVMVTTAKAARGDLQESVSTSGTVAAENVKVFFAPVGGKLGEIKVAAGDAVHKGDVLIAYDSAELERSFRQATLESEKANASYNGAVTDNSENQSKLREAETNLAVLEQQIADNKAYLKDLKSKLGESQRDTSNALAKESYDLNKDIADLEKEIAALDESDTQTLEKKRKRLKSLQAELSRNTYLQQIADSTDYVAEMEEEISDVQERIADYEAYKTEMESQKNSSEAAVMDSYDKAQKEADKELAGLAYVEAETAYYNGKAGICAEFDGVVTEVSAVEGSTVTEGAQLLTLESSEAVKVSFSASKQDVEKLQVGQAADVTISGNSYSGKVSKINRMATLNASNTPMVGVEIHIDEPDDRIILGLDAKLTIYTQKAENALLIPVEAVNADKEGDFLFVVEKGVLVRKPVVCGISNDTYTVVLEGITEEDEIVLSYFGSSLEEGMAVTVMPAM